MIADNRLLADASRRLAAKWSDPASRSSVEHLLPDLVGIIEEAKDVPVAELRCTIHAKLVEQHSICDSTTDEELAVSDRLVDDVVELLEAVRARAIREGRWVSVPVTPLMFG